MLHALVAEVSSREVWWIHGARNGGEHPFAAEIRALLKALPHSRRKRIDLLLSADRRHRHRSLIRWPPNVFTQSRSRSG